MTGRRRHQAVRGHAPAVTHRRRAVVCNPPVGRRPRSARSTTSGSSVSSSTSKSPSREAAREASTTSALRVEVGVGNRVLALDAAARAQPAVRARGRARQGPRTILSTPSRWRRPARPTPRCAISPRPSRTGGIVLRYGGFYGASSDALIEPRRPSATWAGSCATRAGARASSPPTRQPRQTDGRTSRPGARTSRSAT